MLYPFIFHPIFKERVWGGRKLESLYAKSLPPLVPVGESWEISDRPGDVNVIANGSLAGKDLHWLVEHHSSELLGQAPAANGRFPLLIKILDAQDTLSLQVHPPAAKAIELGGEPKTEMWYVAHAEPDAELFVGLKHGITRSNFEDRLRSGTVAECFHRIKVRQGDAMFLPSGRVHALGAGLVIFEIQQNSDTTYRVFDWNRMGLNGKPRELHLKQAMASIDFDDFEPQLVRNGQIPAGAEKIVPLANDPLFKVDLLHLDTGNTIQFTPSKLRIIGVVQGGATIKSKSAEVVLEAGRFCLIPASVEGKAIAHQKGKFLMIQSGDASCQQPL